ncbi:MAG: cytochrome c oxidase subunit II [Sphingomonadales bacterium]|nr:cytochrome c oxidase subunit II [Sphingomonadales bacterium]
MKLNLPKNTFNSLTKKLLSLLMASMATVMSFAQSATDVIEPPQEFDPSGWNWVNILICVLILLIVLVIARAFDIGGLAERITGKKIVSAHKVNGIIALVVLILGMIGVFWEINAHGKHLLLGDAASEHGESLDSMFMWTFGFTFFVFVVTEVLLFFFMFKYYYREDRKAAYFFHNNKLEVIWTIVPAIVLTFLVLRGFNVWTKITQTPNEDAQEIEVFAYQFGWKARYAGEDQKFGESSYVLISGTNPLGLAVDSEADKLATTLTGEVAELEAKVAAADDSAKVWRAALNSMEATGLNKTYVSEHKALREKVLDAESGAYVRQMKKEIKRKETNLKRIASFKSKPEIFNKESNDDRVTTEIVLVKNKPYMFRFRARDVIHSAYMPEFRAQMNCVPGMSTVFPFTPIKTTAEARASKGNPNFEYYLYCNKICGAAHYNMKIKITVVGSESEYNTWLAAQAKMVAPPVEAAPAGADSTAVLPAAVAAN